MIKVLLLSSSIYLTPTINNSGSNTLLGLKFTQKITNSIWFKVRITETISKNEVPTQNVKAYLDFDF